MHKELGTFLNSSKISITFCVLILWLATLRTCNPAQQGLHLPSYA